MKASMCNISQCKERKNKDRGLVEIGTSILTMIEHDWSSQRQNISITTQGAEECKAGCSTEYSGTTAVAREA